MERIVREATKGLRPKLREKQPLDDAILDKIKQQAGSLKDEEAYTVIHDACELARELLGIVDDETRWELMHHVWVGMLCYSASMCKGDLHAKSLEGRRWGVLFQRLAPHLNNRGQDLAEQASDAG